MSETRDRIQKLATLVKLAQMAAMMQPGAGVAAMPGGAMTAPTAAPGEMMAAPGAAGMEEMPPEEMVEDAAEPTEEEEPKGSLDKPTSWIVKYDKDKEIFWVGKAFPKKNLDQVISFFSQRKSVPKAQVREYLEKLMEGKDEKMPEELSQAPEIEDTMADQMGVEAGMGEMPATGAVPGGPDEFAALQQMG